MVERYCKKKLIWVLLLVFGVILILGKSVATAESEFQSDNPNPEGNQLIPTENEYGPEINNLDDLRRHASETTTIRTPLSLEASNYFIIPPSGFVSDGFVPNGHFISFGGGYLVGYGEDLECMAAAVHLPFGASIEGIEVRINDQNATWIEYLHLQRINLETGDVEYLASVSSPEGTTTGIVSLIDDTVPFPIVSEDYAYQFTTCVWPLIYIYGVRIGYSFDSYLPTVQN